MVSTKNGTFELTTIEGDGQKIGLTSQMKDYPVLMEYIRRLVNEQARETGQEKAQEITAKEQRQQRILLPIVAVIYGLMFIGFGIWFLQTGNSKLGNYRLLEARGVTTPGHVVGTDMRGSKSTTYYIDYAFQDASGVNHKGESPVNYSDYQNARRGQPVTVKYLPDQTNTCMIVQSIGKSKATNDIRLGYLNITLGVVTPLLLVFGSLNKKKRR